MTVLAEILAKGEVEPELLVELTDEQKIVLFYKIRQEQIKRWEQNYTDISDSEKSNTKLDFLKGEDGNEWVWVMGDSPGDESFDQIWVKYALQNAEMEARKQIKNNVSVNGDERKEELGGESEDIMKMHKLISSSSTEVNNNDEQKKEALSNRITTAAAAAAGQLEVEDADVSSSMNATESQLGDNEVTDEDDSMPFVDDSQSEQSVILIDPVPERGNVSSITESDPAVHDTTLTSEFSDKITTDGAFEQQTDSSTLTSGEQTDDSKFPVEREDVAPMQVRHERYAASDSSEENMPFPLNTTSVNYPDSKTQTDMYKQPTSVPTNDSGPYTSTNSEVVTDSGFTSVQDRLRLFGAPVRSQMRQSPVPKDQSVVDWQRPAPVNVQTQNIPIFKPVLSTPDTSIDPKFPVYNTDTRTLSSSNYNPNSGRNDSPINFQANFGKFPPPQSYSPIQPPMFRPNYNGNAVRPYLLQSESSVTNVQERNVRIPMSTSASSQGGAILNDKMRDQNLRSNTPTQSPHFDTVDSPLNTSKTSSSSFDTNFGSGSGFTPSMNRTTGSQPPQHIKTNPLAKPPSAVNQNQHPAPPNKSNKPMVPPRRLKYNPTPHSTASSQSQMEDQSVMNSINLDVNVSQLIAKQNVMVQRFLRQSIIHDEQEANALQSDWEERERKAKESDEVLKRKNEQFREMARRVIQEQLPVPLSRAFLIAKSSDGTDGATPHVPRHKMDVIQWFQREELPSKAACDPETGAICLWFHGLINRDTAENMLRNAPVGSFLIRVSEKIYGYTLSYRADNRCKHFLIDKNNSTYQFFGLNMKLHRSLFDLVAYHRTKPVSASGNERLLNPIGQVNGRPLDYAELFQRNTLNHSRNSSGNSNEIQTPHFPNPTRNLALATKF